MHLVAQGRESTPLSPCALTPHIQAVNRMADCIPAIFSVPLLPVSEGHCGERVRTHAPCQLFHEPL